MNEAEPEPARVTVAELDSLLGRPLRVLDDGFVRVVDYMGSDEAIVQAARISFGAGTRQVSEDRGLIRYLMRHRHTTPFADVRDQAARPRADGLLEAMDTPPDCECERVFNTVLGSHRRCAENETQ